MQSLSSAGLVGIIGILENTIKKPNALIVVQKVSKIISDITKLKPELITKVELIQCKTCNKKFYNYKSNKRIFCSQACSNKYNAQNGKKCNFYKIGKEKRKCIICDNIFEIYPYSKKKFCNLKCYGIWTSQNRIGNKNWNWKEKITKHCLICNKQFFIVPSEFKRNKNFCSKKCLIKYQQKENSPHWQGGLSFEPYTIEFNNYLKETIRQRDNYKCQLCGVPQMECLRKLAVHHIDYNKKNCSEVNLIALCLECNIKVNKNRMYWEEYFTQYMISKIDFKLK